MKILSIKMRRTIRLSLGPLLLICSSMVSVAQTGQSTKAAANIKLALNAFSFNDMLTGKGQPGTHDVRSFGRLGNEQYTHHGRSVSWIALRVQGGCQSGVSPNLALIPLPAADLDR